MLNIAKSIEPPTIPLGLILLTSFEMIQALVDKNVKQYCHTIQRIINERRFPNINCRNTKNVI